MARKRKGKSISLDLSEVETNRKAIPEGQYTVVVNSAEMTQSQSGNDMVKFEFEVTEGKHKGAKLYENCSLQPQALFKLKSLLIGLGFSIPNKAFDLDLTELIGLSCEVEVGHEKYEGKTRARILTYIDPDGDDEDEGDDDEDEGPSLEDLDMDELKELATELGLPKKKWMKLKKPAELAEFIEENADPDDLEEALSAMSDSDEDDEEDEDKEEHEAYETMSLKELKEECANRGIKVKKGMDKDDLIELLEEDDED